jgi:hypothetical protein
MQWQKVAALFWSLSLEETTLSSSLSGTTSVFLVDVNGALPPIHERKQPDWSQAKCWGSCAHGPSNLFYADHQHNGQVQEAKSVCEGTHPDHPGRCPVLDQCLE